MMHSHRLFAAAFAFLALSAIAPFPALADEGPAMGQVPAFDAWALCPWDDGADLASKASLAASLALPGALALILPRDQWKTAGLAYGESLMLAFVAKDLLKAAFPRARPYAYSGVSLSSELLDERDESFPSGHTTLAFCAAASFAVLATRLAPEAEATPWLITGGFGLAAGTAVLRVASGSHFPSDVVAGALLGGGIGWLVTSLCLDSGKNARGEGSAASLAAGLGRGLGQGLVITIPY